MTLTPLSLIQRRRHLATKQTQIARLLRHRLECLTRMDIAALAPASRARLVDVLERVSAAIPADLVARLRVVLAETEVEA
jgi:hypothetical protein